MVFGMVSQLTCCSIPVQRGCVKVKRKKEKKYELDLVLVNLTLIVVGLGHHLQSTESVHCRTIQYSNPSLILNTLKELTEA